MGDDTLQGYAPSDFSKIDELPMTVALTEGINSSTTKTLHHFSMPSGKDTVKVRSAFVADGNGDPVTGLSFLVEDTTNSNIIHSETSAQIQEGRPLAEGGSEGTKVEVYAENFSGSNLGSASGNVVITLE